MKSRKGFYYYFGIVVMAIGAGALIYSIISRDPSVFGKLVIVLIVGIVLFVRELRAAKAPEKPREK